MASARPIAVVRLSAKIDTSVAKEMSAQHRERAEDRHAADGHRQRCGQQAAEHPDQDEEAQRDRERLHQQQVALRLLGDLDVDHRDAARAHGDAVAGRGDLVGQLLGVLLLLGSRSPLMPATTSPAVRSLLTRSAAAAGGVVHGEVTFATCGD